MPSKKTKTKRMKPWTGWAWEGDCGEWRVRQKRPTLPGGFKTHRVRVTEIQPRTRGKRGRKARR